MDNDSELLMLRGVVANCADCGDERVFLPIDAGDPTGEYCCTSCDSGVYLSHLDVGRRRSHGGHAGRRLVEGQASAAVVDARTRSNWRRRQRATRSA